MSTWKWSPTGIRKAAASCKLQAFSRELQSLYLELLAALLLLETCSLKLAAKSPASAGLFVNTGLTWSADDASICSTKGPVQTSPFAQESPLA
jgi:hypothetical protein